MLRTTFAIRIKHLDLQNTHFYIKHSKGFADMISHLIAFRFYAVAFFSAQGFMPLRYSASLCIRGGGFSSDSWKDGKPEGYDNEGDLGFYGFDILRR